MPNQTNQELKTLLKNSQFLKLKVKPEALEDFVKKILALPEKKLQEALKVIGKADQEIAKYAEKLAKNTETYLKDLDKAKKQTLTKFDTKVSRAKLKKQIKK